MIDVAAAIIHNEEGKLLIARRKPGKAQAGLWEFPGGKLEPGEAAAECLIRELMEEMNIEIRPYEYFDCHEHDYGTAQIRLIAWKAEFVGGTFELTDHDAWSWAERSELAEYHFAQADVPFVKRLMEE
ncbi:(deoxy)nucleoside triphosphate pyrophosphohydrolase [Paenibacillus sp. FSL R7-0331]|uniref:(deoxy)nucleoside triphosphate pyrophosphohydrolase n=1 Tax=Paenibacillus sp. FSL R7-0331 TaxID=1536773 RepID=UPI0004F6586C|nr:(deoxy)nucleoside triphosphate pyrophosphohydrolase [Paenibacillus sp. FSL R7-0331]AIQ50799.1 NUDIX hydrolase [Paenibacillus sp. FSL R7-0331]